MNAPQLYTPSGHRIGAWHPRAKLPDVKVAAIRVIHTSVEAFDVPRIGAGAFGGYAWLGLAFGCGASTARDIVKRRTRTVS